MPCYAVQISDIYGYTAERTTVAEDQQAAMNKVDALCATQPGDWRTTGAVRRVQPDEYLAATERVALPAVVAGVMRDM